MQPPSYSYIIWPSFTPSHTNSPSGPSPPRPCSTSSSSSSDEEESGKEPTGLTSIIDELIRFETRSCSSCACSFASSISLSSSCFLRSTVRRACAYASACPRERAFLCAHSEIAGRTGQPLAACKAAQRHAKLLALETESTADREQSRAEQRLTLSCKVWSIVCNTSSMSDCSSPGPLPAIIKPVGGHAPH